jgi:transcriptional regulator with XRE-family HTH domain
MAYPAYLRERARALRVEKKLTLDEIAERLALPKTTVYYWIRDLPLAKPRSSAGQRKGSQNMQANYRQRRDDAYADGLASFDELVGEPTFRDFVVLYIAEGYKRDRNSVAICNSDPAIVAMSAAWLRRLSDREPVIRVHYHADQDPDELARSGPPPQRLTRAGSAFTGSRTAASCGSACGDASTASRPSRSMTCYCALAWVPGWTESTSAGDRLRRHAAGRGAAW